MSRSLALLLALAAAATLVPPAAAEMPTDGACDATGKLVCAGGNAGATVTCTLTGLVGSCAWTRGLIWDGFSKVALPGSAVGLGSGVLEVCIAGDCTHTTLASYSGACSFIGLSDCGDAFSDAGTVGPITLALGQCLHVTVRQTVDASAWVPSAVTTLATAEWSESDVGAGEVCPVDDGR